MRHEQEKQRATHLMILLVYTIATIILMGESLLLGWEAGAVVLFMIGLAACWVLYITGKVPETNSLWLYFILTMLSFFFYGIHETSVYDLAPVMIAIIILYSVTEMYSIIRLCVATYFLTMCYDFVFVLDGAIEMTPLSITRILLHFVLVCMVGKLMMKIMQEHDKERMYTENRIGELEETTKRAEDFLANVSHELRTPINAVTGITTVMLKNEEDEDKRKDIFAIQMAGQRLFGQIEDILDFTEIDTGKVKVSEDTYMISSIVNDIITESRLSERENMPELIFDIDADMPSVLLGDGRKIKKILKHLIDNGLKFTQKGGVYVRICALTKPYGINLYIRVSDTGAGIAPEELGRITERFYQSSGGRNRKAGGLGLGLSIVYGLVNAMKGFIQIESTVGSGTTVSISIPQKVSEEAPSMMVADRRNLCLACFLMPEKYEVPEVRDYYNELISHLVESLDLSLHRVSNMDELERVVSKYQLTHLFIGREEYEENKSSLQELTQNIEVVVVADSSFALPQGSRAKILRKPFFCLPIVNLLNAGTSGDTEPLTEKNMLCPGVKVLVVDDEPMNLMVAEGILGDYQMTVKTADSGRRAMELCEEEEFDLIFLDHMMPEMDGVETLKRLRKIQIDQNKVFTIIAFTANAVSGARDMFRREGFDEFVSKPIEPLELERVLRKVLPKSSIVYVDEKQEKDVKAAEKEKKNALIEEKTDRKERESASEENKMKQLESAGIHTNACMQYCSGDRDFYMELITNFAKDAKRKAEKMDASFKQEDLENYHILVHALKSSAKMVGADALSEMARETEEAAKNRDTVYIREHHKELLAAYHEVVQGILDVSAAGESDPKQDAGEDFEEVSSEELLEWLGKLKESLDTFEADKAENLLSEMSGKIYQGNSVEELLINVRQDVEDFELSAAFKKVENLINGMKGGVA